MFKFVAVVVCVASVLAATTGTAQAGKAAARGWGDDIDWYPLDDAIELAKAEDKPIMMIIHKSWCGACKRLKPQVAESASIAEYAKNFIMVNAEDDEEPEGKQFKPDGGYIPRILYLNSKGEVDSSIYNEGGNAKYKYYYVNENQVLDSMTRAHAALGSESSGEL